MTPQRRRVYLTIIAVGLVLVAVDRLYIQGGSAKIGPQAAEAAARGARGAEPAADQHSFARVWIPPVSLEVPGVWRELAEQADALLRQPFGGGRTLASAGLGHTADDGAADVPPAGKFEDRHRLEAILSSPVRPRAIIDGRVVTVGESIDGFVVEEIEGWRVRLRGEDGVVTLVLPSETLSGRGK